MFLPVPEEVLEDLLADKKEEEENALKEVIEKKENEDTKKNVAAQKRLFFWGYEKARLLQFSSILTRKAKDFFIVSREIVFDNPLSVAQEWLKQEMILLKKYMEEEEEEEEEQERSFLKGFTNLYRISKLLAITRNAIESFTKSIRTLHDIFSKYTIKELFENKQKREDFVNELKSRWADILDPIFFGIKLSILTAIEDIFSVILPFISSVADSLIRAGVSVVKGVRFLSKISYRGARAILVGMRETALYRNLASRLGKNYIVAGTRTALQRFGAVFSGVRRIATKVGESATVRVAGNVLGAMGTGIKVAGRAAGIGFNYGAGFIIDLALGHSLVNALERNKFSLAVGGFAAGLMIAGVGASSTVAGIPIGVLLAVAGVVAGAADMVSNLSDEAKQVYKNGMKMLKGVMNAFAGVTIKSRVEGAILYSQYYKDIYNKIGFNRYLLMLKEEGGIRGNYFYYFYQVLLWIKDHLKITFDRSGMKEYKKPVEEGVNQLKTNLSDILSTMNLQIDVESTVDWIIKTTYRVREIYSYKGKLVIKQEKNFDGSTTYNFTYNNRPIKDFNKDSAFYRLFKHVGSSIVVPKPEQDLDIFGGGAFKYTKSSWSVRFSNLFTFKREPVSFNDYQEKKIEKMEEKTRLLKSWENSMKRSAPDAA